MNMYGLHAGIKLKSDKKILVEIKFGWLDFVKDVSQYFKNEERKNSFEKIGWTLWMIFICSTHSTKFNRVN